MLSRRLLRVKVMQVLYASRMQGDSDFASVSQELKHSIEKSYEMYALTLLLPSALKCLAQKKIDAARGKLRPTPEELHPNMRFVNNRFIAALENSEVLGELQKTTKLSWVNDEDTVKALFNEIIASEAYELYMIADEDSFDADKRFVLRILNKELPKFEDFFNSMEAKSIYWNDEIEFVVSIAAKSLKNFHEGEDIQLVEPYDNSDDKEYSTKLLHTTLNTFDGTYEYIKQFSTNWDPERVAPIDVVIIAMAVAEMMSCKDIPVKVTLNEYIEVAKFYSTPKSHIYINGILEKIVRVMLEQKLISPQQLIKIDEK